MTEGCPTYFFNTLDIKSFPHLGHYYNTDLIIVDMELVIVWVYIECVGIVGRKSIGT